MFRILLVVLALFPCMALGQEVEPPTNTEASKAASQAPVDASIYESEVIGLIEQLNTTLDYIRRNTITDERPSQYESQSLLIEKRDLGEQSSMAIAAWVIVVISFFGVCASVAAVILVKHTLKETRKASGHTNDMLTIAKESSRAELRAYFSSGC